MTKAKNQITESSFITRFLKVDNFTRSSYRDDSIDLLFAKIISEIIELFRKLLNPASEAMIATDIPDSP